MNNTSMVGVYVGAYSKPYTSEVSKALVSLWREKKIRSVVTKRVSFEDVPSALEDIANRRATGKIVICD